jgi:hypothetical protein
MHGLKRAAVAIAAALMLALTVNGTAHAETTVPGNPYSPERLCSEEFGGTFKVVDQVKLKEGDKAEAFIYLARNGKEACVTTLKAHDTVGQAGTMLGAWVETKGNLQGDKSTSYEYYAGPVRVTADCVHWGGRYGETNSQNTPGCW